MHEISNTTMTAMCENKAEELVEKYLTPMFWKIGGLFIGKDISEAKRTEFETAKGTKVVVYFVKEPGSTLNNKISYEDINKISFGKYSIYKYERASIEISPQNEYALGFGINKFGLDEIESEIKGIKADVMHHINHKILHGPKK